LVLGGDGSGGVKLEGVQSDISPRLRRKATMMWGYRVCAWAITGGSGAEGFGFEEWK
jgi:hypothetical protein